MNSYTQAEINATVILFSFSRWMHSFLAAGAHEITVTVYDVQGTTLSDITSYVMVQEPIRGLVLSGPEAVIYSK